MWAEKIKGGIDCQPLQAISNEKHGLAGRSELIICFLRKDIEGVDQVT